MRRFLIFLLCVLTVATAFGQALYFSGADFAQTSGISYSATTNGTVLLWIIQVTDNNQGVPVWKVYSTTSPSYTYCFLSWRLTSDSWGTDCIEALLKDDNAWKWRIKNPDNWTDSRIGNFVDYGVTHDGTRPYMYAEGLAQSITWKFDNDRTPWLAAMFAGSYPANVERWSEGTSDVIFHQALVLDYALDATEMMNLHLRIDIGGYGSENNGCKNYFGRVQNYQAGDQVATTPETLSYNLGSQGSLNVYGRPYVRESLIPVRRLKMF